MDGSIMAVHIRYRFLKESGDYLKDPEMTRGYTLVEAGTVFPFHYVLRHFYKEFKERGVQIFNIWRTASGEANYKIEEQERRDWIDR